MQSRQEHNHNQRLRTLEAIFGFCLFILAGRFYVVQICYHKELQAQAEHLDRKRVAQIFPRPQADLSPGVASGREPKAVQEAQAQIPPRIKIHPEPKGTGLENIKPSANRDVAPQVTMPSVQGLSMRRVLRVMANRGLQVQFEGSGVAVAQAPLPGKSVTAGTLCRVRFAGLSQNRVKDL